MQAKIQKPKYDSKDNITYVTLFEGEVDTIHFPSKYSPISCERHIFPNWLSITENGNPALLIMLDETFHGIIERHDDTSKNRLFIKGCR